MAATAPYSLGVLGGPDDLGKPRAYLFGFQPFLTALHLRTCDINDQEKSDCLSHMGILTDLHFLNTNCRAQGLSMPWPYLVSVTSIPKHGGDLKL